MKFEWNNPYPTVRTPVFARNVVSTSQPLAAQAGLRMLQAGGNAVDAAIAAAAVITMTEPCSNGLGPTTCDRVGSREPPVARIEFERHRSRSVDA